MANLSDTALIITLKTVTTKMETTTILISTIIHLTTIMDIITTIHLTIIQTGIITEMDIMIEDIVLLVVMEDGSGMDGVGRIEVRKEALFTFSGRISARRRVSDAAADDEGIASPIAEETDAVDEILAASRKLIEKVNKAQKGPLLLGGPFYTDYGLRARALTHMH